MNARLELPFAREATRDGCHGMRGLGAAQASESGASSVGLAVWASSIFFFRLT